MRVLAHAKSVQMSPKKVREVASLIRGRSVSDALTILEHTPRRAALPIEKLINSARSNALNNHSLSEDSLVVETIEVNSGGSLKRWRPVARGGAHTFRKRRSHISVGVSGKEAKATPTKPTNNKTSATKTAPKKEAK